MSSAESELHSMVSGCSDAIFLRRCMEFLTGDEVEPWQWVDNSAARQLIERQGVGRTSSQWQDFLDARFGFGKTSEGRAGTNSMECE